MLCSASCGAWVACAMGGMCHEQLAEPGYTAPRLRECTRYGTTVRGGAPATLLTRYAYAPPQMPLRLCLCLFAARPKAQGETRKQKPARLVTPACTGGPLVSLPALIPFSNWTAGAPIIQ